MQIATLPLGEGPIRRRTIMSSEVHFLSGYEPSPGGTVRVSVDRPGKSVLLVLSSYEKVLWLVEPTPGTSLAAIVVGSHEKGSAVSTSASAQGVRADLPYATGADQANFRRALVALQTFLGIEKLDGYQGSYRIPEKVVIAQVDAPRPELSVAGPKAEPSPVRFEFSLVHDHGTQSRWAAAGPLDPPRAVGEGRLAVGRAGEIYRIASRDLQRASRSGASGPRVILPANFPEFSWPTSVAYDSDHDVVAVATLGGEGFLYRLDAKRNRWIDYRSLQGIDVTSMAYDSKAKRFVAWTTDGELLVVSPSGELQGRKRVVERLPHFGSTYDRGNARLPALRLVPQGNHIAMLYVNGGRVDRIWLYRVDRDDAVMTYVRSP